MQFRHALGGQVGMFRNYLLTAFRHLRKDKTHSFINIAGLSIGMAVALLIGLWITDELSFSKNFGHYDRIAQVFTNTTMNGERVTGRTVPVTLAEELRKHYGSNFEQVVMTSWGNDHLLQSGTKVLTSQGSFMEEGGPEMLTLQMLQGSRDVLKQGSTIMLSRSLAAALFGNSDPMGRVVRFDNQLSLIVRGVYTDIPENSAFNELDYIVDWQSYLAANPWVPKMNDPWGNNSWRVFVQIAPNTDMATVSARIRDAKQKNVRDEEKKNHYALLLQPMSRWNLYSEFKNGVNTGGRIEYVWMFGIIGVFVLLLACINFMNLSTARSERRAREVGIRKAIGGLRSQLIYQFFSESMLLTLLAFGIALVLVSLSLQPFNAIAGKSVTMPWGSFSFWAAGLGFCLVTGLIAGSYPALYLSSFRPVKVLKGTARFRTSLSVSKQLGRSSFKAGRFAALPRQVLVVVQFTVSVSLIIGTVIVFRQIQIAKDRPVGYDQNGLVMVPRITGTIHKHYEAVREDLIHQGAVTDMAESSGPPTQVWSTNGGFDWPGKDPSQGVDNPNTGVSVNYGKTVGWQFVAGRDFSKDFATDTSAFVINEAAVKFMGLKNPVGTVIKWDGYPFTIIGVIKDMLMESPYSPVRPSFYCTIKDHEAVMILRVPAGANMAAALDKCKAVFTHYDPAEPFDYKFVDKEYAKKFGDERRVGQLAGVFALLAILISCLGLFGMASFMAEQRTREIGVRKVLGASVVDLWGLLSKDFVLLVGLSLVIAMPLSAWVMKGWLAGYTIRTSLSWWIFAAAGAGALVITVVTVGWQAIRAAMANPVDSLRSE
ncbi:MAG TPA: ABC transporter permease [Puia sp.]|nr:ABC transporter permease [Puia sp.]